MTMDAKHLREIEESDEVRKNLAKWIVYDCFRNNTNVEGLHEKFSQEDMREFTRRAGDNVYYFLSTRLFNYASSYTNETIDLLKDKENLVEMAWNKWDDPNDDVVEELMDADLVLFKARQK